MQKFFKFARSFLFVFGDKQRLILNWMYFTPLCLILCYLVVPLMFSEFLGFACQ